jgi:hypothetical protein
VRLPLSEKPLSRRQLDSGGKKPCNGCWRTPSDGPGASLRSPHPVVPRMVVVQVQVLLVVMTAPAVAVVVAVAPEREQGQCPGGARQGARATVQPTQAPMAGNQTTTWTLRTTMEPTTTTGSESTTRTPGLVTQAVVVMWKGR